MIRSLLLPAILFCCLTHTVQAQTAVKSDIVVAAKQAAVLQPSGSPEAEAWYRTRMVVIMNNDQKRLEISPRRDADGKVSMRITNEKGKELYNNTNLTCTPGVFWETPFNYGKGHYTVEMSFAGNGQSQTAKYAFSCK
jgi:hypothetical protein